MGTVAGSSWEVRLLGLAGDPEPCNRTSGLRWSNCGRPEHWTGLLDKSLRMWTLPSRTQRVDCGPVPAFGRSRALSKYTCCLFTELSLEATLGISLGTRQGVAVSPVAGLGNRTFETCLCMCCWGGQSCLTSYKATLWSGCWFGVTLYGSEPISRTKARHQGTGQGAAPGSPGPGNCHWSGSWVMSLHLVFDAGSPLRL